MNKIARYSLLEQIQTPQILKNWSTESLLTLCEQIRERIIEILSINGGHLSSNLGIVELSVAMHYVFDSPHDKFIYDTSHQSYPHKLLTGRHSLFSKIRTHKGLCGFTHPNESIHDHFFAGHAGTALSLALGMAKQRDLLEQKTHILPILGDASLTCGLTLEALNNIPENLSRFIVILNDNKMSISESVGNIKNILSRFLSHPFSNKVYAEIQTLLEKIPGYGKSLAKQGQKVTESIKNLVSPAAFFEQFGLSYVGPIDGHDVKKVIDTLSSLRDIKRPTLVHVMTTKGKGMPIACENPTTYHGVKPFDPESGKFHPTPSPSLTFPKIFGMHILDMAEKNPHLVVINPATPKGSSLDAVLEKYPERCIDVGIAEGHAVTFAGGIGKDPSMQVICNIYATFMQRALDNVFHDVCLQKIPVVFTLDRAFISGPDGSTHHGIYDISFFRTMPNMVIAQPRNGDLLRQLLNSAFSWKLPTAIRYPNLPTYITDTTLTHRELGQAEILSKGEKLAIISLGHMNTTALEIEDELEKIGIYPTIIDPIFIKPLDEKLFTTIFQTHKKIVTIEEHSLNGGLASAINEFLIFNNLHSDKQILNIGIPDIYIEHGKNSQLYREIGLDNASIYTKIINFFGFRKVEEKQYDHSFIST